MNIIEKDKKYIAGTYARFPAVITEGKGSLAWDENGKEYIDMGSGIAVNAFGYADDIWAEAVKAQLGKVQHTSNLYYTKPCADLAETICERTGMKKVFFSNSGAEANETAIKAARKYAAENRGSEYCTIVTMNNSFHGRTLTTLAATGQEHYHELFTPLTPGFVSVEPGDIDQLKKTCEEVKAAGIMMEVIQGEGGVNVLPQEYVKEAAAYAKEKDLILIIDEVQTGNGRTGKLYGYMNYGIQPDVFSTAKGLGGGLPLGATVLSEKLQNIFSPGDNGSTFGGNPVCCAGALSIMERLDDEFLAEVVTKGEKLRAAFEGAPGVKSVSGMGLMTGIETEKPAGEVVMACLEKGVLCLTAKNKVRLLPPLNTPEELLLKAAEIIKEACV
ncbi:MAG: acetylornithine transaminase [Lachnospiraceae bacterium]|nr:acetylornithine transaminase [Lachnospiraceae bacterium]